jgi:hypothetical protein
LAERDLGPLLPAKSEGADISAPKSEKEATMRRLLPPVPLFVLLLLGYMASAQSTSGFPKSLACDENGIFCTEVFDSIGYEGHYTGHDEPSLLFYSTGSSETDAAQRRQLW